MADIPADTAADQTTETAAAFRELGRLAFRMARTLGPRVAAAAAILAACLRQGGKVLVCGNGGSAADAQHFVAELLGRLKDERRALPAISLCVDPSVVTALANDYGFERIFARQVEGLGRRGDVLVAISTSGRSANVLEALATAHQRGLRTIALLGGETWSGPVECDLRIHVPHQDGQRIQEGHTALLHALCGELEKALAERNRRT